MSVRYANDASEKSACLFFRARKAYILDILSARTKELRSKYFVWYYIKHEITTMTEFNKLVRDKIPAIIEANGEKPVYRVLEDDDEYLAALLEKDREEGRELAQDPNLDELADKLAVLYAIAKLRGYSPQQIEQARFEKEAKRGGFEERIFLERTE